MPYKDKEKARESSRKSAKKYREKNKKKVNIVTLGRYHRIYKKSETYQEYRKDYMKKYRAENKEKIKAYQTTEEQREKSRIRAREYQKNNRGKIRARCAFRKKYVNLATPDWVDKKEIIEIYNKAVELEKLTGVKYHVDHVIPLKNKCVCGLHVPCNLRIVEAKVNLIKGNNFDPSLG